MVRRANGAPPEVPAGRSPERLVYVGVGLAFALFLLSFLVYQVSTVVLVLLLTLLFTIVVSGPVDYLSHRGFSRGLATLVVVGAASLVLFLAGLALAPVVERQARELAAQVPALVENAQDLANRLQGATGIELLPQLEPAQLFDTVRGFVTADLFAVAADIGGGIVNFVTLAVVAFIATVYLVLRPAPVVSGFVALFPAERRPRVREILVRMYVAVQRWFLGQLVSMTLIGILSAVALSVIGIPFAVLLGLISGIVSFVPVVGPVLSVIPPVLLALSGNPLDALLVIAAYVGIQAVESNLVQPLVMSRAVSLHPAVILFSLLIMGTLFGFVGVLLAVPLAAALHVLVQELWIKRMDNLGADPDGPEGAGERPAPRTEERDPETLPGGLRKRLRRLWRAATDRPRS